MRPHALALELAPRAAACAAACAPTRSRVPGTKKSSQFVVEKVQPIERRNRPGVLGAEPFMQTQDSTAEDSTEAPEQLTELQAERIMKWDSVLTSREDQVARMLAKGETNRWIAEALDISIKTVDTHRLHVLKKTQCKNNVELCRLAIRLELMKP